MPRNQKLNVLHALNRLCVWWHMPISDASCCFYVAACCAFTTSPLEAKRSGDFLDCLEEAVTIPCVAAGVQSLLWE